MSCEKGCLMLPHIISPYMVSALAPCHPLPNSAAEPITVLKDSVSGGGSEAGLDLDARLLLEMLWDLCFASRPNESNEYSMISMSTQ